MEDPLDDLGALEDDLDIAAVLALLGGWHADFLEAAPYLRSSQSVSSGQNEEGEQGGQGEEQGTLPGGGDEKKKQSKNF